MEAPHNQREARPSTGGSDKTNTWSPMDPATHPSIE
jgi:hypothetical protein